MKKLILPIILILLLLVGGYGLYNYPTEWKVYKSKECMTVEISEKYGPVRTFKCDVIFENKTVYRLIGCGQDKVDIYKSNIIYLKIKE